MTEKKNVLVIGEAGTGKSSLINVIVGEAVATVTSSINNDATPKEPLEYGNYIFHELLDCNDSQYTNYFSRLFLPLKFRRDFCKGISLIILTMTKGRITAASKTNYDYFVETLCEGKVPVLLVVTHFEDETSHEDWLSSQDEQFNKLGMKFKKQICGCTADLHDSMLDPGFVPSLRTKRSQTQKDIREALPSLVLETPVRLTSWWPACVGAS